MKKGTSDRRFFGRSTFNMLHRATMAVFFVALAVLALTTVTSQNVHAAQTVPYKVNFQGRLTDSTGTVLADGNYNMTFRIFSASTGGTAVWSEVRSASTQQVALSNGLFNVQLGDVTALSPSIFTSYPLYVEVELPTPATATCTTANCATYTEGPMTPRQAIASSPYAMNADTLDGNDLSAFALVGQNNIYTGTNTYKPATNGTSIFQVTDASGAGLLAVDSTNNRILVGAGSAGDTTGVALVLDTKTTAGDPIGVNGAMYYNGSLNKFRCYENGSWTNCITQNNQTVVTLGSDVINNSATANTISDVTGLSFAVVAGQTYHFSALINYTTAAANTGSLWTVNGPAASVISYTSRYGLSASSETVNYESAYNLPATAAASTSGTNNIATLTGIVTPTSSGTLTIRFASGTANAAVTAKAGSTLTWW